MKNRNITSILFTLLAASSLANGQPRTPFSDYEKKSAASQYKFGIDTSAQKPGYAPEDLPPRHIAPPIPPYSIPTYPPIINPESKNLLSAQTELIKDLYAKIEEIKIRIDKIESNGQKVGVK